MALRNLRFEEDPILRKIAKPVKAIDAKICALLDDMAETMTENSGVGLAAPQVGVLKRVIVIDIGEGLIELINPEILETEGTQQGSEGCLSIPGKSGVVERPLRTKVKALNRDGEEFTVEGEGYLSVALNHEIDHLNGILYIDKVISMDEDDEEEIEEEEIIYSADGVGEEFK